MSRFRVVRWASLVCSHWGRRAWAGSAFRDQASFDEWAYENAEWPYFVRDRVRDAWSAVRDAVANRIRSG